MEKGSSGGRLEKFLESKGFYIVLALCIAVIGAAAYMISQNSAAENKPSTELTLQNEEPEVLPTEAPVMNDEGITENETVEVGAFEDEVSYEPTQWAWPVQGTLERGYSVEALAYDVTMADWRTHDGIDIAAEQGALVRAAAAGIVESVEQDELYGTTVIIDHGSGIKTVYSNLAEVPTVKSGDRVECGEVIGSVGTTALCEIGEGTHLHFAVSENGESADPTNYLPQ